MAAINKVNGRLRSEMDPRGDNYDRLEVREWQKEQAELCRRMMNSLAEQVTAHKERMGVESGTLSSLPYYEQAEGATAHQVKEDVKRLRRELLLLAKSYGWSYGH